jgi:hypothetical protein
MKKISILFLLTVLGLTSAVRADEGMWLLPLLSRLNMGQMGEMGLELNAEDIYSINNSSIKDAIVIFGRGCTAELISDQGLLLTNHHCGYDKIQALSSIKDNYLKDGFWALSQEEELVVDDLSVRFLRKMEDVTSKVLGGVSDTLSFVEKEKIIEQNISKIKEETSEGSDYEVLVKNFFEGNQYFLVEYDVYSDVRFVGAPPSSIGKFGYDTDNWMWPRHTGDFSLFRVYADKEGNPASYSPDNVPLKPQYHLPISLKGYEKGDFAMTLGFPGSTSRYLSSWGIKERTDIINETYITARDVKQKIWHKDMMASDKVYIQYASKYSRSTNYWKNSIGMNRGIRKLKVVDSKKELEAKFYEWVSLKADRQKEYGDVLFNLEKVYRERAELMKSHYYLWECLFRGTEIISFGNKLLKLEDVLKEEKEERIREIIDTFTEGMGDFLKDYSVNTDHKVFAAMLELYYRKIKKEYHPEFYKTIVEKKFKGNFSKYADYVFKRSFFTDTLKLNNFLKRPSYKVLVKDPVFLVAKSTYEQYKNNYSALDDYLSDENDNNRLFVRGLMEMDSARVFYPDANFTMRLSYGKVGDYEPKDAVVYKHFTTLAGVIEKEQPTNYEFQVPEKLKQLFKVKDYGPYAAKDGTLHVCFTSDNDITGGNSGSPVINARGELFGLAFDGNWEAMSGNIAFETELQKCINVDIRYVLFIIDKYANAANLIDEMTIVK